MNRNKPTNFDIYLREQLGDPDFKKHYGEFGKQLEVAYTISLLRKQKKISQKELAEKINTTQGNIARIEAGKQNVTVRTLDKLARVFGRELRIDFA